LGNGKKEGGKGCIFPGQERGGKKRGPLFVAGWPEGFSPMVFAGKKGKTRVRPRKKRKKKEETLPKTTTGGETFKFVPRPLGRDGEKKRENPI